MPVDIGMGGGGGGLTDISSGYEVIPPPLKSFQNLISYLY